MIRSRSAALLAVAALTLPAALRAQYAAGREVRFTIRVENVSTPATLKLSNGRTAPAPTAPLLWTITDEGDPLFTADALDRGQGLERLAEDGNPAPGPKAIALFEAKGQPRVADVTSELRLWDAGTEVNEEPGLGPSQAPRQAAPNTGAAERKPVQLVQLVHDRFTYPATRDVVKVTIRPSTATAAR